MRTPHPLRRLRASLVHWLNHPRLPLVVGLVGVVLCLPSLGAGLMADDYVHWAKIAGSRFIPASDNPTYDLFVFFAGTDEGNRPMKAFGLLPWWSADGIKASFFRPLVALTHQLDYTFFPSAPWLIHLHCLLWMGLSIVVVAMLYRRLMGTGAAAGLAGLLFAIDDAHGQSITWIANRNVWAALFFSGLVLLIHDRWRKTREASGLVLALLAYIAGLLCGEATLAVTGYLFAYALFLDKGTLPRRLATLAPYAAITLFWAIFYKLSNFGTYGSPLYIDPMDPDFPLAVLERVPVLFLSQWGQITTDVWVLFPRTVHYVWAAVGGFFLLVWFGLFRSVLRDKPVARFWCLGMFIAFVPVCAAFPMDRLLVFAGVGGMGLLACWLEHSGWLECSRKVGSGKEEDPTRGGTGVWMRRAVSLMVVLHLVLSPLLLPIHCLATQFSFGLFEKVGEQIPDEAAEKDLVIVNGMSIMDAYGVHIRSMRGKPVPRRMELLGPFDVDLEVRRLDARRLRLAPEGGYGATRIQQLFRSDRFAFTRDEVFEREFATFRVEEVNEEGLATVVRAQFAVPLEDPSLYWLVWKNGNMVRFQLPEIGETVVIHPTLPGVTF